LEPIDLRSDTVTKPTRAMREAMARAEVGDDAYGEDPTVRALERAVAVRLAVDDAVYVPTGTMANQLAIRTHTRPGQTLATFPHAHVRIHEDASAAALSGVQIMAIGGRDGFDVAALEELLAEESCGWPPVGLVWLETTIGAAGGVPWPFAASDIGSSPSRGAPVGALRDVSTAARAAGKPIHLDGARLWNAHIATGVPLAQLAAVADTISVCMSKGLGAPMGSLLAGKADMIARARALRHGLGGAMRQAGIVAAAGLHALEHHVERLADDHARARQLAQAIEDLPCWTVGPVATNMVLARVAPPFTLAEQLCAPLRAAGVICYPNLAREVRLVTHLDIDDAGLHAAIARIRATLGALA
jgi:threonine aldolase